MKTIAAVLALAALTGCATPEQNILAGAAIGAVIGSEVSRQQQYPQHRAPVIIHQPPPVIVHPRPHVYPRPLRCDYYPIYDAWGYYRGERRVCY